VEDLRVTSTIPRNRGRVRGPRMSKPLPPADGRASIQPAGGSYKPSSVKEGLICPGIWAILSAVYVSGFRSWGEHAHREKSIISAQEWAELTGAIVGQFVLMAICPSAVGLYRRRKNVTSLFC
jgi:hypothetical protein